MSSLLRLLAVLGAAVAAAVASSSFPPPPSSCAGAVNAQAVIAGGAAPLVKTVAGGKLFVVSGGNLSAPLSVVHLYGSTYDMHHAYGQLLQAEIAALVPQTFAYLYDAVNASVNMSWLPEPVRDWVIEYGVDVALDLTYNATAANSPPHWLDALAGMAAGSGVDAALLRRVSMIAEWTRASCSIVGAWGPASASGSLVQLRALDWDTDGPFQQFPVLAVFHPSPGSGSAFATLGWAGMMGAITGVSSSGLAVSEKVWDAYQGSFNMYGYAWNFLLQDILQYDADTDAALSRVATANRTCAIWIGLGDAHGNGGGGSFKILAYSHDSVSIYNDRNFPAYPPAHDLFDSLLFINKHVQPSSEPCMNDLMHALVGARAMSGDALARYVAALEQTGDSHIAVFDFTDDGMMWIANASPVGPGGDVTPAYASPFVSFNMSALWAEPPPA